MADSQAKRTHIERIATPIDQETFRAAVARVLRSFRAQIGIAQLRTDSDSALWSSLRGWSYLQPIFPRDKSTAQTTADPIRSGLPNLPKEERLQIIKSTLRAELGQVLQLTAQQRDGLSEQTAFVRLGLDSLLAIELRSRIETTLGVRLSAVELLDQLHLQSATLRIEAELTQAGVPYETGVARYKEIARGHILGDPNGMLKLIFHIDTKKILGVWCMGTQATELVHIGQAVMALEGSLDYFIANVFNYPTLAECYKVAALDGFNKIRALGAAAQSGWDEDDDEELRKAA